MVLKASILGPGCRDLKAVQSSRNSTEEKDSGGGEAEEEEEEEEEKTEEEEELYNCSFSTPTMMTSEYIVAARGSSKRGSVPDWVPIAQVCLKRPESEYQDGANEVQSNILDCCDVEIDDVELHWHKLP